MTALPSWLTDVLDRGLPMLRGRERDELAEMIVAAIPKEVIVEAIKGSAHAVLEMRVIRDADFALSQEIANNSAASVLLMLQVGDECEVCDGDRFIEIDEHQNEVRCHACNRAESDL